MTTVEVTLPDDLAEEARKAGLLEGEEIAKWLREELRRQRTAGFLDAIESMDACDDTPSMSPEEISDEIHRIRKEHRAKSAA